MILYKDLRVRSLKTVRPDRRKIPGLIACWSDNKVVLVKVSPKLAGDHRILMRTYSLFCGDHKSDRVRSHLTCPVS